MRQLSMENYSKTDYIILNRDDTHTDDSTHTDENDIKSYTIYEPEHMHDFIEISYILSGSGVQLLNGSRYLVQQGDIVVLNLGEYHAYYPLKNFNILNCLVSPQLFNRENAYFRDFIGEQGHLSFSNFLRASNSSSMEINQILFDMEKEYIQKRHLYREILQDQLRLLLLYMQRVTTGDEKYKNYRVIMRPILDYISQNYHQITLGDVSAFSSYNPTYFSKMFRDNLGMTFTEYVNRLRINEALHLIKTTNMTIETICFTVGYKEKKHFYALFKQFTGVTPGMIRRGK